MKYIRYANSTKIATVIYNTPRVNMFKLKIEIIITPTSIESDWIKDILLVNTKLFVPSMIALKNEPKYCKKKEIPKSTAITENIFLLLE